MRELSIEEKARRFDEALTKARNIVNSINVGLIGKDSFEAVFPELAESEDERIKKAIKYGLDHVFTNNTTVFEVTKEQCLSWFEKQVEQKPTVKPKFHEDDWVVNNTTLNSCHIIKVEHGQYICDDCSFPITKENEYHLWTIQDAKDGDVLINDFHLIFIFKEIKNNMYISHCSIIDRGDDVIVNSMAEREVGDINLVKCHPATKEQRDTLIKAMADTGYTFDFEKKELKKIEQKPTECINDAYPETLDKAIDLYYYSYGNGNGYFENLSFEKFKDIVKTFVSDYSKQKPAEWNEEDEENINTISKALVRYISYDGITQGEERRLNSWLKNRVQPQPQLKPSEEQIEALESVTENCAYSEYQDCLRELTKQLKEQLKAL